MDQNYIGGLFVIDAGGGTPRLVTRCLSQLCAGGAREANPAWSPDGGLIAFSRERNIFLVRPDGTCRVRSPSPTVAQQFGEVT